MAEGNVEKTKAAPVTAIIAQDMEFYEKLPKLFRLRTRARGSLETSPLSNRQHSATAAYKALISSLLLVPSASTAVRCQALTMPRWMRPFLKGQPGNQISSAISVMEIRANFVPEHRALNLMMHAKSANREKPRPGSNADVVFR
jgi:hypothetical protein